MRFRQNLAVKHSGDREKVHTQNHAGDFFSLK